MFITSSSNSWYKCHLRRGGAVLRNLQVVYEQQGDRKEGRPSAWWLQFSNGYTVDVVRSAEREIDTHTEMYKSNRLYISLADKLGATAKVKKKKNACVCAGWSES